MGKLTEEELRRMEMDADTARGYYARHGLLPTATGLDVIERVGRAVAELRTLRATAFTQEEREALAEVLRCVQPRDGGMPGMVSPAALAVLARLTGGAK